MLSYRSFVDVLFILLLGTLVMLTQSVQLGAVDTALAKLGSADKVLTTLAFDRHVIVRHAGSDLAPSGQ